MNRPPFPSVLDASLISTFRACPQKAFLEYVQHWKPRSPSVHLHAGAAYASALEATRRAFYLEGKSSSEAAEIGMATLLREYGDFPCPEDSAKSASRMAGALEFYLHSYPLESDAAVPVTLPDGSKGIEVGFAEPLPINHPETGDPLIYAGRLDMMVNYAGAIYGLDDKTTSSLGASWASQWSMRSQFTGYCLSGDTEVLTPEGWARLDELEERLPVAQWSNGNIEFAVPTEYHRRDYTGNLVNVTGKVAYKATPDHRVVVYDSYSDSYKSCLLKDLPKNSGALRYVSAGWKQDGEVFSEDVIKLLVAIQADGSWVYGVEGKILHVRFSFSKERKQERLLQIVKSLGMEYIPWNAKDAYRGKIQGNEILTAIESLIGKEKKWGSWLLRLDGNSLRCLMEELRYWDGALNDTLYSTSIQENADWIQTVASLCGMRASIHTQKGWKTDKSQYRVSYATTHHHSVHLHQHREELFDGKVYCLTVPSSHFLIRYQGKISVTGNCWGAARLGFPLSGFLVRGVSILKTKYDTQQALTYRPQWMIDRWYEQLLRDIHDMLECWESGIWDWNLDASCEAYGGCPFKKVCLAAEPDAWLSTGFERRSWDPITRKESLLES